MAHLYKKVKKGHEYYYIRETQRVYGKPTTVNQVYLGTADKVEAAMGKGGFSPKEFGSIFVLNELERNLDLAGIVNEILPPKKRTKGPSLGELVFYAAMNRAIAPTSKRRLASWYETTDIQRIRPLRLESLNSQNFWNHWDRISDADLEKISTAFLRKVHAQPPVQEKHLVIEAANLASSPQPETTFDLSQMVEGLADLPPSPQLGLALISEMFTGIPVHYQDFPGGLPRTGFYHRYLDDLLAQVSHLGVAVKDVTLLFNKGTDPEEIIPTIDAREDLHFIASCTPDFAPELTQISLKDFSPLPGKSTAPSGRIAKEDDRLLYYETRAPFWLRDRRVIIIFDPKTFHQSYQDLGKKVHKVRKEVLAAHNKCRHEGKDGEIPERMHAQLEKVCQRLKLSPSLFFLSFRQENGQSSMDFQLDHRQMAGCVRLFGKKILLTDHVNWSAVEIYEAYANRCLLESDHPEGKGRNNLYHGNARDFRSPFIAALLPFYHWTDSKIRIHLFVCMVALTYLALLCQRLNTAGLVVSPQEAMEELRSLKTAIHFQDTESKLKRVLENVTDRQSAMLQAFGYQVQEGKVVPL